MITQKFFVRYRKARSNQWEAFLVKSFFFSFSKEGIFVGRVYTRTFLGAIIASNLLPLVLKKVFSFEMIKNDTCLRNASKQNTQTFKNIPLKNAPMPPNG